MPEDGDRQPSKYAFLCRDALLGAIVLPLGQWMSGIQPTAAGAGVGAALGVVCRFLYGTVAPRQGQVLTTFQRATRSLTLGICYAAACAIEGWFWGWRWSSGAAAGLLIGLLAGGIEQRRVEHLNPLRQVFSPASNPYLLISMPRRVVAFCGAGFVVGASVGLFLGWRAHLFGGLRAESVPTYLLFWLLFTLMTGAVGNGVGMVVASATIVPRWTLGGACIGGLVGLAMIGIAVCSMLLHGRVPKGVLAPVEAISIAAFMGALVGSWLGLKRYTEHPRA
jgi:hypothetical protein